MIDMDLPSTKKNQAFSPTGEALSENADAYDIHKINISAYRVMFILLMLVRYRSLDGNALNRLLLENPRIGRAYNPETLTKYVNTLREVGCRIPRSTSRNDYRYDLPGNPFPLCLDPEEWAIAGKLREMLAGQTDTLLLRTYEDFLSRLRWCAGDAPTSEAGFPPPDTQVETADRDCEAESGRRREMLAEYQAYCRAAFTLEILYREGERETGILMEPHSTLERDNRLWLLGTERGTEQSRLLDLEYIVSVRQMPAKNRRKARPVTVVFSLYGRLAAGYRPYPDEKIMFRTEDEIRVQAKTPETSGLTDRLFRYGAACRVISPDSLRETIRLRIARLLEAL